jgi:hypothetical protein
LLVLGIALISIVPFGLAWYYASHPELVNETTNRGTLVLPPHPLNYADLLARPLRPGGDGAELKGRWILLHVAFGQCEASCADALHKTRQVRLMLNKEIPRVKRLLLMAGPTTTRALESALKLDDSLAVFGVPDSLIGTITDSIGKPPADGMVFLIDPLGNLMLWYENGFDPYDLDKDLKHLLRASQIG